MERVPGQGRVRCCSRACSPPVDSHNNYYVPHHQFTSEAVIFFFPTKKREKIGNSLENKHIYSSVNLNNFSTLKKKKLEFGM